VPPTELRRSRLRHGDAAGHESCAIHRGVGRTSGANEGSTDLRVLGMGAWISGRHEPVPHLGRVSPLRAVRGSLCIARAPRGSTASNRSP
jgi:hypothetical protein